VGVGCTAFFLVGILQWSSLSLLCVTLAAHLATRFLYYNGMKVLADVDIIKPRKKPVVPAQWITEAEVQAHVGSMTAGINATAFTVLSFLNCNSNELTMKAIAVLLGVALLTRIFGTVGVFFLAFVCAFTLPKVYEAKQTEVDAVLSLISAKLHDMGLKTAEMLAGLLPKKKASSVDSGSAASKLSSEDKKKL
jgi:hypothetical protein